MEVSTIQQIFCDVSLSEQEINIISNNIKKRAIPRGSIILSEGQPAPYLYYISSGCLRTFFIDSSGKEQTMLFAVRDLWLADCMTFLENGNALLNIECLQDAVIYQFSRENLEELYSRIPKIERFFRIRFEKSLISFQKRILASMEQSATERYLMFMNTYPNIIDCVKSYHVASYLGITPESLSRIKKGLISINANV